jgi:hypothetical protein
LGVRLFERAKIGPRETTEQSAAKYKSFLYDLVFHGIATQRGNQILAKVPAIEHS